MKFRNAVAAIVATSFVLSPVAAMAGTQASSAMPTFASVSEGARASMPVARANNGVKKGTRAFLLLGAAGAAGLGIYFAVKGDDKTSGS